MVELFDSMNNALRCLWRYEPLRFLFLGSVNSLTTLFLMQALLFIVPFRPAYILAYITGVIFVTVIYPRYVFRQDTTVMNGFIALSVYLSTMVITLMLTSSILSLGISAHCLAIVVCAFSVCLNYFFMKLALRFVRKLSI
jgi:hypothetical protein